MKLGLTTLAALVSLGGLITACGTEEELAPAGLDESARSDEGPVAGSDGDGETQAPACEVPEFVDDSPAVSFEELRAEVVDANGDGVSDVLAQACGMNLCLFGFTDDTGFVLHRETPARSMQRVAFKYGDGLEYAQFAFLLPDQPVHDLGAQATVALPPVDRADDFEAGRAVTSSDATLTLADDAAISFDLLTFPESKDHRFVAVEMPEDTWPDAVTSHDLEMGLLYVLGPLKTEFCPPAELTLPNTAEWDAGANVEFLLHITDTSNHWGVYGEWAVIATGEVSEDGESITTDESSGIPQLGALGVRLADD